MIHPQRGNKSELAHGHPVHERMKKPWDEMMPLVMMRLRRFIVDQENTAIFEIPFPY